MKFLLRALTISEETTSYFENMNPRVCIGGIGAKPVTVPRAYWILLFLFRSPLPLPTGSELEKRKSSRAPVSDTKLI